MKVIIPMAGHSRRSKEMGCDVPKPFIIIDGKLMIERVCQMFSSTDEFVFVCSKDHLLVKKYRMMLKEVVLNYHIVEIEPHDYGPVYSVLQAEECITDESEPIIISYCDFTMQWNYRQFLLKACLYEGAVVVFKGFHPASLGDKYYGYVKANEDMEMIEIREKQPFTDNRTNEFAAAGVYYFESWKAFCQYANEMISDGQGASCEYHCSLVLNYLVRDNKKVVLFEADKFICWGTPQDLKEYQFWSDYFARDVNRISSRQKIKSYSANIKSVSSGGRKFRRGDMQSKTTNL